MDKHSLPKIEDMRQASDLRLEAALVSVKEALAQLKLTVGEYKNYVEKNREGNGHKG